MTNSKSIDRQLQILGIRNAARMIVGQCSDYQIVYVAKHAKVVFIPTVEKTTVLEDLSDLDVDTLYTWLQQQEI